MTQTLHTAARPTAGRRKKLVLVGNGMAGMRAVEELLTLAPDLYDVTVFGSEPHGNYNRILLSPACSVMPCSAYQSRGFSMMSAIVFSAASTGDSRMRL